MKKQLILGLFALLMAGASLGQTMVSTFDNGVHMAANTLTESFAFPEDNSGISQILMHFNLTCPAGGCDPWDRYAHIQLESQGRIIEIGRYITPYGNNWCDWTLDVTEYRNLLQGEVTLKSFIETWSNGWAISVDFEFISGTADYEYVKVDNLWQDYYFVYGDTIFNTLNLPSRQITIPANAEKTVVRVVNTGHGQGNTGNAAEFLPRTHEIRVNGQMAHEHNLWNDDCNQNPCSPQGGTWEFGRAGWCPGQEVTPADFDITSLVTPGETVSLDYVLESYFNECSPWNPNCQNGITCASCTYNNNGHTEPNYKMSIQLLNYGNSEFTSTEEQSTINPFQVNVYPNPSQGLYRMSFAPSDNQDVSVLVMDLTGRVVHQQYLGNAASQVFDLNLSGQANGSYLLIFQDGENTIRKKITLAQ